MKPFRFIVIFMLTVLLLCGAVAAQARVYVDISKPFAKKFPLAVPEFQPILPGSASAGETAIGLADSVGNNLDLTGLFIVLDRRTFLEANRRAGIDGGTSINFKEWMAVGSELLIKGAFSQVGEELTLELRLFDVFEGRMMLGKRYVGHQKDARQMINRFCNEVLYLLTGQAGIFGTKIVFGGTVGGHKQILMAEFGGDKVVQLTSDKAENTLPVVAPNGSEVAYLSRLNGKYSLKMLTFSGEERTVSASSDLHLTPCFTPGGGLMAAISGRNDTNIYMLDPKGRKPVPVTNSWGINISPTVAPDGSQFAYVSNRAGGPQIYVSAMGGGEARRLTLEGKENTDPQWSPRGDRIVFVGAINGTREIFTINPDGTDRQQLTADSGRNTHPTWSPDGRMIVFSSTRLGRPMLFTMTANGERQRPLLPSYNGEQITPFWSPVKPEDFSKSGR